MQTKPLQDHPHLPPDLINFLQRFRHREQRHRHLLDHNNSILNRLDELQQSIFILDDIRLFQKQLSNYKEKQEQDFKDDQQFFNKYEQTNHQSLNLKKITGRVLEIAQVALQVKNQQQYYRWYFCKFRSILLRIQDHSTPKQSIVRLAAAYSKHKIDMQTTRLQQIIRCLQMSDYQSIQQLHQSFYKKMMKREMYMKPQVSTKNASVTPKVQKTPPKIVQNQIMNKTIVFQKINVRPKFKKNPFKHVKKWLNCLGEVMDVYKDEMMQIVTTENKQWTGKKLYADLISRNKTNASYISNFSQKAQKINNLAVPQPPQQIFQDTLQYAQPQMINLSRELKKQKVMARSSQPLIVQRQQKIKVQKQKQKKRYSTIYSNNKQKPSLNNMQQNLTLKDKLAMISHKDTPVQFHQTIVRNDSGRSKLLPQISGRAGSVQSKGIKIQLQAPGQSKKNMSQPRKSSNFNYAPNQSKIKWQMRTLGGNFFDQIGQKIASFCAMKKNNKI